jgi:hypothetical protein
VKKFRLFLFKIIENCDTILPNGWLTFFADGFTLNFDILTTGALGCGAELLLGRRLVLSVMVMMVVVCWMLPLLLLLLTQMLLRMNDWKASLGGRDTSTQPLPALSTIVVVLVVVTVIVATTAHFH